MKRIVISAIALLAGIGAATAADLYSSPARAVLAVAEASPAWGGLYAGANAGWAGSPSDHVTPEGAFGGGLVGYNLVLGRSVLGVEADFQGADISDTSRKTAGDTVVTRSAAHIDWFGTVRGRVGAPLGNALIYATGGLAYADLKFGNGYTFADPDVTVSTSKSEWQTKVGWTAGAGVEWALADRLRLRGEYLYVDLGDVSVTAPASGEAAAQTATWHPELHVVRVGLSYAIPTELPALK
ncbi:outer membrane protein [Rhodomicrobium lacus]|uniref:outer membrane protein n=1 Tax=Rhodomicrobium lacus TaxID=2498452 RepID=UPI000F8D2E6A|nr:outer membrane protein [Rhodomicrobium lacus]